MSTHRKVEWLLFVLGILGTLFSGYLSAQKFFLQKCALGETCAYFVGYPACYFGFFLFLLIAFFSGCHVLHILDGKKANEAVLALSGIGTLFAGYVTFGELPVLVNEGIGANALGLPSSAYGLGVFLLIFIFAFRLKKDFRHPKDSAQ